MLKRFAFVAGLTLLFGVVFVPSAHAQTRFSLQIGPAAPFYGAQGPGPGYVWQRGYYAWTGYDYRWVPGGWVRPYDGRRDWASERWERDHQEFHRAWDDWSHDRNGDRYRDREWDRDRGGYRDGDRHDWYRDDRDSRR